MNEASAEELLRRVRAGEMEALGPLLEHYRPYLRCLAQRRVGLRLQSRLDASDIVQQTFLEAQRDLKSFRGDNAPALQAWLLRILDHNAAQAVDRHVRTQKRSVDRERPLPTAPSDEPGAGGALAADQSTPSQRAMRGEDAVRLATALFALSDDQREAVRLRYLEGLTIRQLADAMGRSETAVAGAAPPSPSRASVKNRRAAA